jgi:hypothetical protein
MFGADGISPAAMLERAINPPERPREAERPGVEPLFWAKRLLATPHSGGQGWCRDRLILRPRRQLCEARVDKLAGSPCPWIVSPFMGKTTNWRAGCGRSACPVRREGGRVTAPPYPYHVFLVGISKVVGGRAKPAMTRYTG